MQLRAREDEAEVDTPVGGLFPRAMLELGVRAQSGEAHVCGGLF